MKRRGVYESRHPASSMRNCIERIDSARVSTLARYSAGPGRLKRHELAERFARAPSRALWTGLLAKPALVLLCVIKWTKPGPQVPDAHSESRVSRGFT